MTSFGKSVWNKCEDPNLIPSNPVKLDLVIDGYVKLYWGQEKRQKDPWNLTSLLA